VYDLGLRHYNSIKDIEGYKVEYAEVNDLQQYKEALFYHNPDAIVMNYLAGLSAWLQKRVGGCPMFCVPHDMRENDFNIFRRDDLFDYYIILDKNSPESVCGKISKTNRPLKEFENTDYYQNHIPKIGSFGFALTHKNFNLIVREVNKTFDEAEINFHMPKAYYDFENQTDQVINDCKVEITKSGIKLNITTEFLSEDEVINQLHHNDINCLFYDGGRDLGISSSLDFLISAQKPILITESPMFRSFSSELPTYPGYGLEDIWEYWEKQQAKVIEIYENSVNNIKSETKAIFDRIIK
jgi:hypothetical protein